MKIEGSQSVLAKDNKKYFKFANRAIYIIFIVVVIFFLLIASRVVDIQILKNPYYTNILKNSKQVVKILPPRGRIYDRNGKLLVTNEEDIVVLYYPLKDFNDKEKWELAKKFSERFPISTELTVRELKDLYVYLHQDTIMNEKITAEEKKSKTLSASDLDNLVLERISDEEIASLSDEDKKIFSVKIGMDFATKSRFGTITRNISKEDAAFLVEHKEEYPGFDIIFDWQRKYEKADLLKSILGKVSSDKQGIPIEEKNYLMLNGYNLNDRIGTSGLEKQYEDYLRGSVNKYELSVDEFGNLQQTEIQQGNNGSDLHLTIDSDLQERLNTILANTLQTQKERSDKLTNAMVTITEVETGEVLALASQTLSEKEKNTSYDSASLTYLNAFSPGSTVKGATVYMGLDSGVVKPGEIILDEPMRIAGTPIKKSYNNYGLINEIDALRVSSNIYMFQIALRLGGATYVPNQPLSLNRDLIETMRKYYTSFGLGTYTLLDVPNEALGYQGQSTNVGHALDYAIGQYDTVTLVQLAQYVNTIATKGTKLRPYLVKKIENDGTTILENKPKIDSILLGKHEYLENVTKGFIATNHSVDGVTLALKTGTADTDGHYTSNAVVSFAPADKPKISVACAIPYAVDLDKTSNIANPCIDVVKKVYHEYFELYGKN